MLPFDVQFYRAVIFGTHMRGTQLEIFFSHVSSRGYASSSQKGCFWAVPYDRARAAEMQDLYQLMKAVGVDLEGWVEFRFEGNELIEPCIKGKLIGIIVRIANGRSKVCGYFPVCDIPVVPLPEQSWGE
jgi:hypothetical protein